MHLIPQFDKIDHYKFYDLYESGWAWSYSKNDVDNNKYVLQDIAKDFSLNTGISVPEMLKVLNPGNVLARSSENLLLVYTNANSDKLYFYLTNMSSETYKTLCDGRK